MTADLDKADEELKQMGLSLTTVLQDTHAQTMMRMGSILDGCLEATIKTKMLKTSKKIVEKDFTWNGRLASLAAKIKEANTLGLLSGVEHSDATVIRKIRNEFGHAKSKIHFESPVVVELVKRLSTYEPGKPAQDAIFAASTKVIDQIKTASKQ